MQKAKMIMSSGRRPDSGQAARRKCSSRGNEAQTTMQLNQQFGASLPRPLRIATVLNGLLVLLGVSQLWCSAFGAGEQLTRVAAGDLQLTLRTSAAGVRIDRLLDMQSGQDLLATNPLPLFSLTLRQAGSTEQLNLNAEDGWGQCAFQRQRTAPRTTLVPAHRRGADRPLSHRHGLTGRPRERPPLEAARG